MDLHHSRKVRYYLSGRNGDELNNGAMAQLVARFHGMEEVGGSNPPSSTENIDIRFRVSIFYCIGSGDAEAYSTLRVAEGVAFQRRRCGHRGGILRGLASVASLEMWKAPGGLRAVRPPSVSVNASCAREPL